MPETMSSPYQIPGVYRQDVFPQPPPLFLTGVPVFLGYVAKGQSNQPVRLSSWSQFKAQFGASEGVGFLAAAVHGFFANGGFLCYVLPLTDSGNVVADLTIGLTTVTALDEIDLLCAPDIIGRAADKTAVTHLQQQLLDHCQSMGNRFCILDALPVADVSQIGSQRQSLQGDMGALYYPWLKLANGQLVPPCGHTAGVYSRTDQAVGVHKSPANIVVNDTVDLGVFNNKTISPVYLSDDQQATLYNQGINYLQVFPGRGIRIWGTRTLSQSPEWQQLTVRRLFITIGRWLDRFMVELSFQTNDPQLWVRIVRQISAYLDDLFRQGALKGKTAEQAYFVKCDAQTNPPELYESGVVITEMGLAPTVPAEFIEARIIHSLTGVTIQGLSDNEQPSNIPLISVAPKPPVRELR